MARAKAQILTIGDELLAGDIVDRNAAHLAARCRSLGLEVHRIVSVADRHDDIVAAVREAARASDVCLVSGGLGPTTDDLTSRAVAAAAGVALARDGEVVAALERFFAARGRTMPPANLQQADRPAGSDRLDNAIGTAPGFSFVLGGRCLVACLPGVPRELDAMMEQQVEPRVRAHVDLQPVARRIYRALGRGESAVQDAIAPAIARLRAGSPGAAAVVVHYRAHTPEILVGFEAVPDAQGRTASSEELCELDAPLQAALGDDLYGIGEADLPTRVVRSLARARLTLATAESCTGGLVGAALTAVPGASAVFPGAIVAYADAAKQARLGVDAGLIAEHGAVSEPVARAMAAGGRAALGSDLCVAVTGIAGPDGGTPDKPVGTVHFALADARGSSHRRLRLHGDRGTIRRASAAWALKLVWDGLVERGLASVQALD
jgi:nicotinamide-nucleotide amidase